MLNDHVQACHSFPCLEALGGKLHSFACDAGLIVRRTCSFSAEGFLLAMLKAVCSGNSSFNRIAGSLGQSEARAMSRQAVHSRMKEEPVGFLDAVLNHIVCQRINSLVPRDEKIFRRILIQDSTQLRMHRGNHQAYPAYFALPSFLAIEKKAAWWISRLHGLVEAKLADGTDLEDFLAHGGSERLDLPVLLGKAEHPARLIANRVPEEVAARRRAARREKGTKQGHRPSARALTRDDWTIHVTNLGGSMMSAEAVASAYRLRWEIEIKFRAWKQSSGMARALSRISNVHHLKALVAAAMIYFVLTMEVAKDITDRHPKKKLSFEKICGWLSESLMRVVRLQVPPPKDIRHLMTDRRNRRSLRDLYHSLI